VNTRPALGAGGVAQVIEQLANKCKAFSSNPCITTTTKKKKKTSLVEFHASLGYTVRPCLKKTKQTNNSTKTPTTTKKT
jgi:hypothetical protein